MDPVTVVKIIVAVAEAAKKKQQENDFADWKDAVTSKLNALLEKSEEILHAIQDLKVVFIDKIDRTFLKFYVSALQAYIGDVGNILSGIPKDGTISDSDRDRLRQLLTNMRHELRQAISYGYASVPVALSAYVVMIPAMRAAKMAQGEIDSTKHDMFNEIFLPAIDPMRDGSFAWAKNQFSLEVSEVGQRLTAHLRPTTVAMWGEPSDELPPLQLSPGIGSTLSATIAVIATVTFSGIPDQPDSITATPLQTSKYGQPGYFPMVTYLNVQPPPVPGSVPPNSYSKAVWVRDQLLVTYKSWATTIAVDESNIGELAQLIEKIQAAQEI